MDKFKSKYRIESARLRNWDYEKPGNYFITICCANQEKFFGNIISGQMILNELGRIAHHCWEQIPVHFQNTELGEFQIMPNHMHGIITIISYSQFCLIQDEKFSKHRNQSIHVRFRNQGKNTISSIVGSYKSAVSNRVKKLTVTDNFTQQTIAAAKQFGWHPRFHDHIIRNHEEYVHISHYIRNNSANWERDRFY